MLQKESYVYLHKNILNGEVFYVGKGVQYRANTTKGRSKAWWDYVTANGNDFIVEYKYKNLTNLEAEHLELKTIQEFSESIVNKHRGNRRIENLLDCSEYVKYDETSPTFLRWIKTVKGSNRKVGDVAGHFKENVHCTVCINKRNIAIHRVVWSLCHNREIPVGMVINHIDCNPSNNRIDNLECVTQKENSNKKFIHVYKGSVLRSNKSGINGVLRSKTSPTSDKEYFSYTATWAENNLHTHRSFSILKYGEEIALSMATDWRKVKEIIESDPELSRKLEDDFNIKYSKELYNEFPIGVSIVGNHGKPKQHFMAHWRENGVSKSKRFSINKYGYEEALRLATEYRNLMVPNN